MNLAPHHSDWKQFTRHPRADEIAGALKDVPAHWSLTPLCGKQPFRKNWQTEDFIPHEAIASLIDEGEKATSKRGATYRRYWSGLGLRLGEASDGLLAIDIDGKSAEPLLKLISKEEDVPKTVGWSSGKPGRRQLLFQIPDTYREKLKNFTRVALTQRAGFETAKDENGKHTELLEFRYNRCQSALPPSYHPTTGGYVWINSPVDTPVAELPESICEALTQVANKEGCKLESRQKAQVERKLITEASVEKRRSLGEKGSSDLVDAFNLSVQCLSAQELFNWPGHSFVYKGREWAGRCPRHDSQSGESFTVDPDAKTWHCFGCGVGGGIAEYRHFVNGGNGTPKGKDFYLTTKELSEQAGVILPRTEKQIPYIRPIEEIPEVGFHVLRRNSDEMPFEALNTERGKEWLKLREFTPDAIIDSPFFDYDFKPGEDLAIKSGLGTGKSYFTNKKWLANPDDGAVLGGYRNCLNEQFCSNGEKLNGQPWNQIQQDLKGTKDKILIADPQSRIAGAVDSWIYFQPCDFEGKKVIFDEVESVAKHLNQSNTAVSFYRDIVKQRVSDALSNSSENLIADANLRNFTVVYKEELSGRKFTKILNKWKGNRGRIYLYNGSSRKKQATEGDVEMGFAEKVGDWIAFNHKPDDSSKMHRIMMDLPLDIPLLILSDSQVQCETWDRELATKGRKVFRLDSTTSGTDLGRQFLRNPKEFILLHKIDAVILSPSAESGVSLELLDELGKAIPGYFKYEFAFFFGTATTDTQTQFLGRNRDPYAIKFCFVQTRIQRDKLISDNHTSTNVFEEWVELKKECAALSLNGIEEGEVWRIAQEKIKEALFNPHAKYESKILLKESFERSHPRFCLEYALREQGWDVTLIEGREDSVEDLVKAKEEVLGQRAVAVFGAENISSSEADKIAPKLNKTPEERNQITKSRLLSRLPGIDQKIIQQEKKVTTPEQLQHFEASETIKPLTIGNITYEEWKSNPQPIPEKGIKVTLEKPAFDPDFVNKILNKDRTFVSRLEMQFLLRNPEVCKLIQQNKWYKQLDLLTDPDRVAFGTLPIARYRSKLVEIDSLIKMGIEFFLNPESVWHNESPEAIAFWEKGKLPSNAKKIRMACEDDPTTYIGKVLKKFGLKTKNKEKKKSDGSRFREYSIAIMDSLSQVVYDSVAQRIETQVAGFDFDWEKIVQKSGVSQAENLTGQANQLPHVCPDNIYKNGGDVCIARESDRLAALVGMLHFAEDARSFLALADGYPSKAVEDAIVLQDTQHRRQELQRMWEVVADVRFLRTVTDWKQVTLSQSRLDEAWRLLEPTEQNRLHAICRASQQPVEQQQAIESDHPPLDSYRQGEEVWAYFPQAQDKWRKASIEWIRGNLIRVVSGFLGMHIERSDMIAPGHWGFA